MARRKKGTGLAGPLGVVTALLELHLIEAEILVPCPVVAPLRRGQGAVGDGVIRVVIQYRYIHVVGKDQFLAVHKPKGGRMRHIICLSDVDEAGRIIYDLQNVVGEILQAGGFENIAADDIAVVEIVDIAAFDGVDIDIAGRPGGQVGEVVPAIVLNIIEDMAAAQTVVGIEADFRK